MWGIPRPERLEMIRERTPLPEDFQDFQTPYQFRHIKYTKERTFTWELSYGTMFEWLERKTSTMRRKLWFDEPSPPSTPQRLSIDDGPILLIKWGNKYMESLYIGLRVRVHNPSSLCHLHKSLLHRKLHIQIVISYIAIFSWVLGVAVDRHWQENLRQFSWFSDSWISGFDWHSRMRAVCSTVVSLRWICPAYILRRSGIM